MNNKNGKRRVVITGMGAVTPIGQDVPSFWAGLREGKSGVSALGGFPLEDLKILIAAQIKDFDPKARLRHFQRDRIITLADRYSWFAAAAADEAMKMSGLEVPVTDPYRSACIIGSGAGGLHPGRLDRLGRLGGDDGGELLHPVGQGAGGPVEDARPLMGRQGSRPVPGHGHGHITLFAVG